MRASVFFHGGTLVLQQTGDVEHVPAPFQFVKSRWRCQAYHYQAALPWMREQRIRNAVPRWQRLALGLRGTRERRVADTAAFISAARAGLCRSARLVPPQ
jgi:hypothetical protein